MADNGNLPPRILFLAINPGGTERIRVDKEAKIIKERLERGNLPNNYELVLETYIEQEDLSFVTDKARPEIFHFSGHGEHEGIYVDDDKGRAQLVTNDRLVNLFKSRTDTIQCVVFNSCLSESLASKIAEYIPYVIGTNSKIEDDSAIEFSKAFYGALATGDTIETAFEKGKSEIALQGKDGVNTPVLINMPLLRSTIEDIEGITVSYSGSENGTDVNQARVVSYILSQLLPRLNNRENIKSDINVQLIFLSNSYLNSQNCCDELKQFAKKEISNPGTTFVLELDNIESNKQLPDVFKTVPSYQVWKSTIRDNDHDSPRTLDTPPYDTQVEQYVYIGDLANDILNVWKGKNYKTLATVYIARTPDTIQKNREKLVRFLKEQNVEVLPSNNSFPLSSLENEMKKDLEKCSHFIQILDEQFSNSLPFNQYHVVESFNQSKNIEILLWNTCTAQPDAQTHPKQKELLQLAIMSTYTEFKQQVKDSVLPEPEPIPEPSAMLDEDKGMVFINTGEKDTPTAIRIGKSLHNIGFGYSLIRYSNKPSFIRKLREKSVVDCDYMLMLQRETPIEYIEELLRDAIDLSKLNREKNKPLKTWLCKMNEAGELFFSPSNLTVITCKEHLKEKCLDKFVSEVTV